jgi:hypothetical protein
VADRGGLGKGAHRPPPESGYGPTEDGVDSGRTLQAYGVSRHRHRKLDLMESGIILGRHGLAYDRRDRGPLQSKPALLIEGTVVEAGRDRIVGRRG